MPPPRQSPENRRQQLRRMPAGRLVDMWKKLRGIPEGQPALLGYSLDAMAQDILDQEMAHPLLDRHCQSETMQRSAEKTDTKTALGLGPSRPNEQGMDPRKLPPLLCPFLADFEHWGIPDNCSRYRLEDQTYEDPVAMQVLRGLRARLTPDVLSAYEAWVNDSAGLPDHYELAKVRGTILLLDELKLW